MLRWSKYKCMKRHAKLKIEVLVFYVIHAYTFLSFMYSELNRKWTEPTYMVRPCPKNGRRKFTQNSIQVDAETKESTRKTEEKLGGRYKEGHELK